MTAHRITNASVGIRCRTCGDPIPPHHDAIWNEDTGIHCIGCPPTKDKPTTMRMYILRGLPGSGKSTYARGRWPGLTPARYAPMGWSPMAVSGDHFFTSLDGVYAFNLSQLGEAHVDAQRHLIRALEAKTPEVVVDNTHSRLWEFSVALELARVFGYEVEVVDLFDAGLTDEELAGRNSHGVTVEIIAKQRGRWEKFGKEG